MVIDFHNHLLEESDYADKLVSAMDEAGIDQTCISGLGIGKGKAGSWDSGAFSLGSLSPDNGDVEQAFRRFPDRLIGMGFVKLGRDGADKVQELADRGFQGLKACRPLYDYDHDACFPVYERAEQLGMPILFHTGVQLVTPFDKEDDVSCNRMRPIQIDRIARNFPALRMVIAHMGMPWFEEAAEMCRFHKNVYTDFTGAIGGWSFRKKPGDFQNLLYWKDAFQKVVFGTDVHYNAIGEAAAYQKRLFGLLSLDAWTTELIFQGNARALLGR